MRKKIEKNGGCQNFPMLYDQKIFFSGLPKNLNLPDERRAEKPLLNCNQNYLFWLRPKMIDFSSKLSPPQSWIFHRICWSCWRWLEWVEIYREHHKWHKLKERWHDVNSRYYDKWNIFQHFEIFSCSWSKMIMKHFLEHFKLWRHHKQQKEFSSKQTKVLDRIIRRDYFV